LSETSSGAPGPIIIKKYANRRLYNTQTSSYVTLDHLCDMVKEGVEFEVRDARTGEDITRQVLAQIIFEEENKGGQHLLPIQFLRQLIRFYGDSLQAFVPSYLELSMESFTRNQQEMREKFAEAFGNKFGFKDFEKMSRQNIEMFERAMRMFSPFGPNMGGWDKPMANPFAAFTGAGSDANGNASPSGAGSGSPASTQRDQEIRELKEQLAAMRQQIADLAQRK
jgi:polyhydroxyalkanoate synthesis repressor PhaR